VGGRLPAEGPEADGRPARGDAAAVGSGELRRGQSLDHAWAQPYLEEGAVVTELACRRCGEVTPSRVIIWGADKTGSLSPRSAECRGLCPRDNAQPARSARPDRRGGPGAFTSIRPRLRAAECGLDIVPGDRIIRVADNHLPKLSLACGSVASGPSGSSLRGPGLGLRLGRSAWPSRIVVCAVTSTARTQTCRSRTSSTSPHCFRTSRFLLHRTTPLPRTISCTVGRCLP
jgi:hypothetical protein